MGNQNNEIRGNDGSDPLETDQRCCSELQELLRSRLQEIMISLVKHLHSFAREVKLTDAEYNAARDRILANA